MLHLVQSNYIGMAVRIRWSEEDQIDWEDKVEKSEEHLKKLESTRKGEREQYEGELGVVLWNSVNTMQADWGTHTRLGHCKSPWP